MTRFDRYHIDGITPPMPPRPRAFPWHQLGASIFWTVAGAALVAALFKIGGA